MLNLFRSCQRGAVAVEAAICLPAFALAGMMFTDALTYLNAREATASLANAACVAAGRYLVPDISGFVTPAAKTAAADAGNAAFTSAKVSAFVLPGSTATLTLVVAPDGMKVNCEVQSHTDPIFGISLDHMQFTAFAGG